MRDYFRHTKAVSHIAARWPPGQDPQVLSRLGTMLFGHHVEEGIHVGPAGLVAGGQQG